MLLLDDEEMILEVGKPMLKPMLKLTCSCWRLSCLRLEAGKPVACLRKKTNFIQRRQHQWRRPGNYGQGLR